MCAQCQALGPPDVFGKRRLRLPQAQLLPSVRPLPWWGNDNHLHSVVLTVNLLCLPFKDRSDAIRNCSYSAVDVERALATY